MEYNFDEIVIHARTGLNPRKNFILGKGNNRYITIKNIKNNSLVIDDNTDFIDDEAVDMIHKRSQIKKGDILFASIGRFGDTYIIEEEPTGWDINESVFAFTVDEKLIRQKYFHYLFKHKETIRQLTKNSSGSTFKSIKMSQLKKMRFDLPDLNSQDIIVSLLDCVTNIISIYEQELLLLDELVKARFMEMFGDPITNDKHLKLQSLFDLSVLKAGKSIKTGELSEVYDDETLMYPCFGGNGIRGYINRYSHDGEYPVIGRQGAWAGNVNYATGKFYATEHAIVVTPKVELNTVWYYYGLKYIDLTRFQTGAAQPGLAVDKLNKVIIPFPTIKLQNQFASFVEEIDKSRLLSNHSLFLIKSITF